MIGMILMSVHIVSATWQGKLKFNFDHTFTILQFTDMHFGEQELAGIIFHIDARHQDNGCLV